MLRPFILFFLIVSLFSSCRFNPDMQGMGEEFLQGKWEEDSVLYSEKLLEYTRHRFTFTCDSFYAVLETHAKVDRYPAGCFNNGRWTEYAKGRYVMNKDTLYLIGTFTKENFKQKISGCHRIGRYIPKFLVKQKAGNKLVLMDLNQQLPLDLKRTGKITCIPKPL